MKSTFFPISPCLSACSNTYADRYDFIIVIPRCTRIPARPTSLPAAGPRSEPSKKIIINSRPSFDRSGDAFSLLCARKWLLLNRAGGQGQLVGVKFIESGSSAGTDECVSHYFPFSGQSMHLFALITIERRVMCTRNYYFQFPLSLLHP